MKHLLLIKTGDTYPQVNAIHGDFEKMITDCLPESSPAVTLYDAREQAPLPDLSTFSGVLITGSHSMVTDQEDWSERLLPYIREMHQQGIPVLGICYGHQLIVKAMGGDVGNHEKGIQSGTINVQLTEAGQQDALLGQLPITFPANVGHQQRATLLPPDAILLASNALESHESFRIGSVMWGVQFHPEFTQAISRQYIDMAPEPIVSAGNDPQQVWNNTVETPESRSLLQHFVAITQQQA